MSRTPDFQTTLCASLQSRSRHKPVVTAVEKGKMWATIERAVEMFHRFGQVCFPTPDGGITDVAPQSNGFAFRSYTQETENEATWMLVDDDPDKYIRDEMQKWWKP